MPIVINNTLNEIRSLAMTGGDRAAQAKRLAELIRKLGDYRWVGVCDVHPDLVSVIGWSGPSAPVHPEFPASKGLTGTAVQQKKAVIVGDVRTDPRYLTSFGSTLSEIIVPVLAPGGDRVIGTVDVESDHANAFSERDQHMIEHCAQAALPLWLLR
ncbi:MAG TPA: GAF domain-containing protein [Candidatus Acidoferrales bacterium]|nr:GAF domain-containing protein [Candidatus Acidoferrales bacterium]